MSNKYFLKIKYNCPKCHNQINTGVVLVGNNPKETFLNLGIIELEKQEIKELQKQNIFIYNNKFVCKNCNYKIEEHDVFDVYTNEIEYENFETYKNDFIFLSTINID